MWQYVLAPKCQSGRYLRLHNKASATSAFRPWERARPATSISSLRSFFTHRSMPSTLRACTPQANSIPALPTPAPEPMTTAQSTLSYPSAARFSNAIALRDLLSSNILMSTPSITKVASSELIDLRHLRAPGGGSPLTTGWRLPRLVASRRPPRLQTLKSGGAQAIFHTTRLCF